MPTAETFIVLETWSNGAHYGTIHCMPKASRKNFLQGVKIAKSSSPTSKVREFPVYSSQNDPVFLAYILDLLGCPTELSDSLMLL